MLPAGLFKAIFTTYLSLTKSFWDYKSNFISTYISSTQGWWLCQNKPPCPTALWKLSSQLCL